VYKKRIPAYLADVPSFTERYHELTKYHPETIDRLGNADWGSQPEPFKDAPAGRKIDLIAQLQALFQDAESPPDPLFPWLRDEALPGLARLLHATLGLTARLSSGGGEGRDTFLRAAPSAGGLYPTEVYVAVRDFPDLPAGIYHYHSLRSGLIPVWEGDFFADLKHHFLGHPAVSATNCVVLFTGIYGRSAWRYKERAYRRILLDTGHAVANLLEMAEAMGLDAALLGGFYDEGLEELLFLGRKEEFPLLGVALGVGGSLPPAGSEGGQRPGPIPEEAVKRLESGDPMQVQQNACERIVPGETLRAPVVDRAFGTRVVPVFDAAGFNAQTTILSRRSTRRFNGGSITLRNAEDMLRFAFRSLGSRDEQPLLTHGVIGFHLVAFAVEGLTSGVYALDPESLALTLKREGDFRGDLHAVSLGQDIAADCAFALVYTADMEALVTAYGDRGYRYACLDSGMIGERVQLWAVHRELGSSGIGGYYDDLANELLDLPLNHGVLYLTVVGVPEE
jgi:SagB-type dehydrogenase family enzyme